MKIFLTKCILILLFQLFFISNGEDDLDFDQSLFDLPEQSTLSSLSDEATAKIKITDLNFDCLEVIFQNLNQNDLLNVAQANTHLVEVANYVARHQSDKIVHICDRQRFPKMDRQPTDLRLLPTSYNRIFFRSENARAVMPLIGGGIKKLFVDFRNIKEPEKLMESIERQCGNTLVSMELHGLQSSFVLRKSFPKIENVVFVNSSLNEDLLQFKKWFPAMKSLKLSKITVNDSKLLVLHYPFLVDLTVDIDRLGIFTLPDFKTLLQLNPQIQKLNILKFKHHDATDRNSDLIEFIHVALPELKELKWGPGVQRHINRQNHVMTFKNITTLDIYVGRWDQISVHFPFRFENLRNLTIRFDGFLEHRIVTFIRIHTDITSLKIVSAYKKNYSSSIRIIVESLTRLKELYLDGYFLTSGELTELATRHNLRKFQFSFSREVLQQFTENPVFDMLAIGWTCSIGNVGKSVVFTLEI